MSGPVPPRTKTFSGLLLCAAALLGAGASACANEEEDGLEAEVLDEETQVLALEEGANGARIAAVTANGTGCPRGSWRGIVAPDGSSVSVRFSSFDGETSRSRSLVVKDCTLSIKLESGVDLSYALADLRISGYAYLRDGANLSVASTAYWQGNPADAVKANATFGQRFNRSFKLGEEVPADARIWSPCGKSRDLNINTRARLLAGGGFGYFELSRIGEVKLAVKRCGEEPDGGETPDGETPDGETPDETLPPSGLTITGVTANGTGCPAGSATTNISPDGQNVTVSFSQFNGSVAEGGSGIVVKDCLLAFQVANPNAQSYGLEAVNLSGTASLGEGANLTLTSNYYFQGAPVTTGEQSTSYTGPAEREIDVTHAWDDTAPSSSCDAARDLNVILRARLRSGSGSFSLNEAGPVTFRLRPCN